MADPQELIDETIFDSSAADSMEEDTFGVLRVDEMEVQVETIGAQENGDAFTLPCEIYIDYLESLPPSFLWAKAIDRLSLRPIARSRSRILVH